MTRRLTADRLRELLDYEPLTGVFTWRKREGKGARRDLEGRPAGCLQNDGYVHISIDGKKYLGHRLAWLYAHGAWPADEIDHRNRVRNDNRLENLREATKAQNHQNRSARGVDYHKASQRWRARISVEGRSKCLGYFQSEAEASSAYVAAKRNLHSHSTL